MVDVALGPKSLNFLKSQRGPSRHRRLMHLLLRRSVDNRGQHGQIRNAIDRRDRYLLFLTPSQFGQHCLIGNPSGRQSAYLVDIGLGDRNKFVARATLPRTAPRGKVVDLRTDQFGNPGPHGSHLRSGVSNEPFRLAAVGVELPKLDLIGYLPDRRRSHEGVAIVPGDLLERSLIG